MTALTLPALDGRTPLGFLAALGVLRLIDEHTDHTPRLAWSTRDCTAVLHDAHATIDDLVADLAGIVASIPPDGVLPGLPPGFPPPGEAPDKLRLARADLRAYASALNPTREVDAGTDPDRTCGGAAAEAERWLASLVTDLSVDDRQRADISLFAAPSGKQSMRTMLDKPLALVRARPALLREAVTAWLRYPGVSGEYLDHRVLFDAVDAPDGRPAERGVPGATWLALMAYPLMLTCGIDGEPATTCWQNLGRGVGRRMVYPLWSRPLETAAVQAVLTHPVLTAAEPGTPPAAASALSIFWIGHAERRRIPGRTFAGVLTPTDRPVKGDQRRRHPSGPRR